MSLSFPHLIHPAADSYYLFLYKADSCRVWPNHFAAPQGEQSSNNFHLHPGSPVLTMKPVCQVIRCDPFYQTCQILWIIAILHCNLFWIQAHHCSALSLLWFFMVWLTGGLLYWSTEGTKNTRLFKGLSYPHRYHSYMSNEAAEEQTGWKAFWKWQWPPNIICRLTLFQYIDLINMLCEAFSVQNWTSASFIFIYCPVSEAVLSQSAALTKTFNTDLGLRQNFSSLPLPFWPLPISPCSSSLHHCHAISNIPAIAASLAQHFRQAIYTVAGHIYLLEVWGALQRFYQLRDALTVLPPALGSLWLRLNLFPLWEFALNLAGVNWSVQNKRHGMNLFLGRLRQVRNTRVKY